MPLEWATPSTRIHEVGVYFELLGSLSDCQTIAINRSIRELPRLVKYYGKARWRKRKGIGRVRLADGSIHEAEIHWYEASGIGKREFKIKRLLD